MNRFRLAAFFACVVLFASCGTKNVSEPVDPTLSIEGTWAMDTAVEISGKTVGFGGRFLFHPNRTASDTMERFSSNGEIRTNPWYATKWTWSVVRDDIAMTKESCSVRDSGGHWLASTCLPPLQDTIAAGASASIRYFTRIIEGIPLTYHKSY